MAYCRNTGRPMNRMVGDGKEKLYAVGGIALYAHMVHMNMSAIIGLHRHGPTVLPHLIKRGPAKHPIAIQAGTPQQPPAGWW